MLAEAEPVIDISKSGNIILDVTFASSKTATRRYRVSLDRLKEHSRFFSTLLTNPNFGEAKLIADRFAALSLQNTPASAAAPASLPWIPILDDSDQATHSYPDRPSVFEDLLRILHDLPPAAVAAPTLSSAATLVILADRYDCLAAVRPAVAAIKYKWPATTSCTSTTTSSTRGWGRAPQKTICLETEQLLRKKILVAYRAGQPQRLLASTAEIIKRGSRQWAAFDDEARDDAARDGRTAAWWDLPDGLERELQFRRECILNTIASVPRHFIKLYSSPSAALQCQRGYESSPACDVFQLGQMIKFFARKDLVYLVDFGPSSLDGIPDSSRFHIADLLDLLKECPSYQIDMNHTNCGLKTRLQPIMVLIEAMLSSHLVPIRLHDWAKGPHCRDSWIPAEPDHHLHHNHDAIATFKFTRSIARDARLQLANAMGTDTMARTLFTSTAWNWTPEE